MTLAICTPKIGNQFIIANIANELINNNNPEGATNER